MVTVETHTCAFEETICDGLSETLVAIGHVLNWKQIFFHGGERVLHAENGASIRSSGNGLGFLAKIID